MPGHPQLFQAGRPWGRGAAVERTRVKSDIIAAVGYDPATRQLEVEFSDGSVHVHAKVPPQVHKEFMKAKSVGYYYFQKVRDRYSSRALE